MGKVLFLLMILVAACRSEPQGYSYSPSTSFRPSRPIFGNQGLRPTRPIQYPFRPVSAFGNTANSGNANFKPANYHFQYDVAAPEYGTRFGHQENRMGDSTRGRYYVVLPNGRTQVVDYTADATGYHPRISYS